MRNASGHQCKEKKKVNENMYDISSKKPVTKKILEVSHGSRAKKGKEMYRKSVLHVQSCCFFLLIRPIVVFHRSPALPSPLRTTRFYILSINKL